MVNGEDFMVVHYSMNGNKKSALVNKRQIDIVKEHEIVVRGKSLFIEETIDEVYAGIKNIKRQRVIRRNEDD